MEYYNIPLKVDKILKGKNIDNEVDIREAIHQNIRLIIKSLFLEYRFDPTFGSLINKKQGVSAPQKESTRKWKDKIREDVQKNLKDMLQRYEQRIKVNDVMVNINLGGKYVSDPIARVEVKVHGQLTIGKREDFYYPDSEVEGQEQGVFPLNIF